MRRGKSKGQDRTADSLHNNAARGAASVIPIRPGVLPPYLEPVAFRLPRQTLVEPVPK